MSSTATWVVLVVALAGCAESKHAAFPDPVPVKHAAPAPPLGPGLPRLESTGPLVDMSLHQAIWASAPQTSVQLCVVQREGAVICDDHPVALGGPARALFASFFQVCAVLVDGAVECWDSTWPPDPAAKPSRLVRLAGHADAGARVFFFVSGRNVACVWQGDGTTICDSIDAQKGVVETYGASVNVALSASAPGRQCEFHEGSGKLTCEATAVAGPDGRWFRSLVSSAGERWQGHHTHLGDLAFSCGIDLEHHVQCFGDDRAGELGDGGHETAATPVRVDGTWTAQEIAVAGASACALSAAGDVYCWGDTSRGAVPEAGATDLVACAEDPDGTAKNVAAWRDKAQKAYDACMSRPSKPGETDVYLGCTMPSQPPEDTKAFARTAGCVPDLPVDGGHIQRRPVPMVLRAKAVRLASAPGSRSFCALLVSGETQCWGAPFPGPLLQ